LKQIIKADNKLAYADLSYNIINSKYFYWMINQKANMNDRPYIFPPLKIHKISRKFCYLNKKHRKLTEIDEAPLLANVPRTKSLT
jgi:hypothetical protein